MSEGLASHCQRDADRRLERRAPAVPEPPPTRSAPAVRPTLLVTLNGGGWHRQTTALIGALSPDEFEFVYVGGRYTNSPDEDLPAPHAGRRIGLPNVGQTSRRPWRHLINLARLVYNFFAALRLIRRLRPRGIVALGTPNALPLFAAGRLFGVRCMFVESLTRTQTLSRVGWILYHLRLCTRLYVQWPQLQRRHPRTTFAGAVL